MFHLNVAKVDRNVTHVTVAITYILSVCSKCYIAFSRRMFSSVSSSCVAYVFTHMKCFQMFFPSVSYGCFECFNCFIRMLQVFHLDVLKVDLVLQLVFQMHISCVSSVFRRMVQVLHPDVSKVDRVLHLYLRFSVA
jgi:hypothetical protein